MFDDKGLIRIPQASLLVEATLKEIERYGDSSFDLDDIFNRLKPYMYDTEFIELVNKYGTCLNIHKMDELNIVVFDSFDKILFYDYSQEGDDLLRKVHYILEDSIRHYNFKLSILNSVHDCDQPHFHIYNDKINCSLSLIKPEYVNHSFYYGRLPEKADGNGVGLLDVIEVLSSPMNQQGDYFKTYYEELCDVWNITHHESIPSSQKDIPNYVSLLS